MEQPVTRHVDKARQQELARARAAAVRARKLQERTGTRLDGAREVLDRAEAVLARAHARLTGPMR